MDIEHTLRILNLYAGVGGNRKLWGDGQNITAVEIDPRIAGIYSDLYPDDTVIIGDAHDYLLKHYKGYDFIWSSPPCISHSRMRYGLGVKAKKCLYVYPDMSLYQEILLLQSVFDGLWCVENVVPYYNYLIRPNVVIGRHAYWSNFPIPKRQESLSREIANQLGKRRNEANLLSKQIGINLSEYKGIDRRRVLRNCVMPETGEYILRCAIEAKERGQ